MLSRCLAARNFLMDTDTGTQGSRFLIRDRGSQFIGTLRRELLDRTLILGGLINEYRIAS